MRYVVFGKAPREFLTTCSILRIIKEIFQENPDDLPKNLSSNPSETYSRTSIQKYAIFFIFEDILGELQRCFRQTS